MTTSAVPFPPPAGPPPSGFDEPLDILHACHDRVRRSLALLREIGERVATGRVDVGVHGAAADVLHYFDRAAPLHHEDEEQHIFPCVLAHTSDAAVRAAVMRLQEDHLTMEALWVRLRVPLAALANGRDEAYDASQRAAAARFCALYGRHAKCEDEVVFPLAAELLADDVRHAAAQEMVRRRKARRA